MSELSDLYQESSSTPTAAEELPRARGCQPHRGRFNPLCGEFSDAYLQVRGIRYRHVVRRGRLRESRRPRPR